MRDWTKAMAALLAAVASVGIVQMTRAQENAAPPTPPAAVPTAPQPAVKADDTDPFAKGQQLPNASGGKDLSKGELQVTDVGTVELHVNNANLLDVLRTLSLQTHKNIITSKGVGGTVSANLYNVTLREALDAILHANGFAYREKGNFIFVYTVEELKKILQDERRVVLEVFRLSYTPADVAVTMIKPVLSDIGQTAVTKQPQFGLPTGATDVGGNSLAVEDTLVVTDYEDNMIRIKKVVADLDRRPQQILVEATILQANLTDTNSLGVDFSILGGVDFSSVGSTNTAVLADNQVTTIGSGAGGTNPTGGSQTTASQFSNPGYNAWGTNVAGPSGKGLNIGVVYNNVALFVHALEEITDTVVLANPKVLTLNKQPGIVIVGSKDGYLTTTTTSTTTVQTVEYLETGTRLLFRPYIADDGFIRMEIHPEDSTGNVTNGLPTKKTTEVTTNVMVKDGHTIVIGGLFREENTTSKSQVPLLGDIPLAGYLFKSQSDTAKRQEVIILITPHIIKDYSMYSEASKEALKYADMIRVGLRKGMMPWSCDRLAEMYYQKAREEMSHKFYDKEKVLWYLDCATNLNPVFPEALTLKQQITGKTMTESDNSCMRHFVQDLITEERVSKMPAVEPDAAPAPDKAMPPQSAAPSVTTLPPTVATNTVK